MASEIPPISAPLLPQLFWSAYDNYDAEERAHHKHIMKTELGGLIFFTALYMVLVWFIAPDVEVPVAPSNIQFAHVGFAAIALYNLYAENFVVVKPKKAGAEDSFFVSSGPFGRWVWLTHQTVAVLAVHAVISLLAPSVCNRLAAGTYVVAVVLAGLGAFVTIQFFVLVHGDADHIRECRSWAAQGIHLRRIEEIRHIPQLLLAVGDVCVLKHRDVLLSVMPPLHVIVCTFLVYVGIYLAVLGLNHWITGCWPYGLMKSLGTSVARWLQFVVAQCCILTAFTSVLWIAPRVVPAVW